MTKVAENSSVKISSIFTKNFIWDIIKFWIIGGAAIIVAVMPFFLMSETQTRRLATILPAKNFNSQTEALQNISLQLTEIQKSLININYTIALIGFIIVFILIGKMIIDSVTK